MLQESGSTWICQMNKGHILSMEQETPNYNLSNLYLDPI
jgi:hypothetical protein